MATKTKIETKICRFRLQFGRYQGQWLGWPYYEEHVSHMLAEGWTLAGQVSDGKDILVVTFTRTKTG